MGLSYYNIDINNVYLGDKTVKSLYIGDKQIWPTGLPVGQVFDFAYTGKVQEITLPKGRYKLECWGAQGGTSSNNSSYAIGGYGGHSSGILTLTETKTLYVFVGGKGASSGNGGWNGGGSSTGYGSYGAGYSYPACGGGATDICTVTSDMSYSNGRTNRSSASLLSRMIVAGGGGGSSSGYWQYSEYGP